MKKTLTFFATAALCGAAFAAANDLLITFSTPGPDRYADGTTVIDGERYALCWSKDFSKFSIKSDGTADGGLVLLKAPVAKNGRCPTVVFEIDASYAESMGFSDGKWAVYMLDTRTFSKDGVASVALMSKVNTYGAVGNSVSVNTGSVGTLAGASGVTTNLTGVESAPEITGIRVDSGKVYVTVKGAPYLGYGLVYGDTPDKVKTTVEGAAVAPTGSEEVTIVTDAKKGGAFFKVGRK